MLFVDFSSAFNTVIPDKLILKLHNLGLPSSLCHWIRDFLSQQASGGENAEQHILYTGPEHRHTTGLRAQPSPLFTLFTSDCSAIHSTNTIVKFADDTTIVGLISDNDETHYREEIQHLTQWCSNNNLILNTSKTKEVIVDYRSSPGKEGSTKTLLPQEAETCWTLPSAPDKLLTVQQCGMAAAPHKTERSESPGGENSTGDCGKSSSRPGLNYNAGRIQKKAQHIAVDPTHPGNGLFVPLPSGK
ncbi:hypothetical protein L3Q82_018898, partial [Scortum barcoo]